MNTIKLVKTSRAAFKRAVEAVSKVDFCFCQWLNPAEKENNIAVCYKAAIENLASGRSTSRVPEVHSTLIKWTLPNGANSYLVFGKGEEYYTDGHFYIICSCDCKNYLAYHIA